MRTVRRKGQPNARAIVSVAFQAAEFEAVSKLAESMGMRTSEFIRLAALGRIPGQFGAFTTAGPGWYYIQEPA